MTETWWGAATIYGILVSAAGLVSIVLLQHRLSKRVRQCVSIPCLAVLFASLSSLVFSDNQSISLILTQEVGASIFEILFALVIVIGAWFVRKTRSGKPVSTARRFIMSGIGLVLLFSAWSRSSMTLNDFLLPHEHVTGRVVAVKPSHFGRYMHMNAARLEIGPAWYYATTDIEPLLTVGTEVDAEVSAGSRYILALTKPTAVSRPTDVFFHGSHSSSVQGQN